LTIYQKENKGYNEGAKAALSDAMRMGWWKGYDWIIRVNPDVIIRDDRYLRQVMEKQQQEEQNSTTTSAILVNCIANDRNPIVHTDFFALNPSALPPDIFIKNNGIENAERSFTNHITNAILNQNGQRWVDSAKPKNMICRVGHGREMEETDVIHYHWDNNIIDMEEKIEMLKGNNDVNSSDIKCPVPF